MPLSFHLVKRPDMRKGAMLSEIKKNARFEKLIFNTAPATGGCSGEKPGYRLCDLPPVAGRVRRV